MQHTSRSLDVRLYLDSMGLLDLRNLGHFVLELCHLFGFILVQFPSFLQLCIFFQFSFGGSIPESSIDFADLLTVLFVL